MTLRILARAGEAISAGDRVVIENGKVMVDKVPPIIKPIKKSYDAFGLFDRHGSLWEADVRLKNLESFKEDVEDADKKHFDAPFRIVPVIITPVIKKVRK